MASYGILADSKHPKKISQTYSDNCHSDDKSVTQHYSGSSVPSMSIYPTNYEIGDKYSHIVWHMPNTLKRVIVNLWFQSPAKKDVGDANSLV